MADERPIDSDDFARIQALIHTCEVKVIVGEGEALCELLRGVHADYFSEDLPPLPLDELVGDKAVSRKITRARMVLEGLMRGSRKYW
ncbi:hypothetical protein [Streptomyces sp. NPDC058613]|uniref:hypothetical protein n=1 Tax=Streptomyces sp. NPDC058613 TaxID=3346556 RepID=UPI0036583C4F